jgi:hypothetical protein
LLTGVGINPSGSRPERWTAAGGLRARLTGKSAVRPSDFAGRDNPAEAAVVEPTVMTEIGHSNSGLASSAKFGTGRARHDPGGDIW